MKTKFFLIALAALSVSRLSAAASSPSDETAPVQLPTYVITESRETPAEKQVERSMDALRSLATKPIKVKVALPLPEAKIVHVSTEAKAPTHAHSVVVAGL